MFALQICDEAARGQNFKLFIELATMGCVDSDGEEVKLPPDVYQPMFATLMVRRQEVSKDEVGLRKPKEKYSTSTGCSFKALTY